MAHNTQRLEDFRKNTLDKMGVSYDYYRAYEGNDSHCRWQCTDIKCNAPVFKSFPAFKNHLRTHHDIDFSEVKWMRLFV